VLPGVQRFHVVSSPRTWGCFYPCGSCMGLQRVFPTHVGVFLRYVLRTSSRISLPHARGGVSGLDLVNTVHHQSSPRTWGCFPSVLWIKTTHSVFPTHVGVFRIVFNPETKSISLPHARGGVSAREILLPFHVTSSPRTWGCFLPVPSAFKAWAVFPTHVGVFLFGSRSPGPQDGLPHARGGVSYYCQLQRQVP